jgi:hypothetical protein
MVPEKYKSPEPEWTGKERRMAENNEHQGQAHTLQSAIVKIEVMSSKFETMEKMVSTFMEDMKDFRKLTAHDARQNYEYLDEKIDTRCRVAENIAQEALSKVSLHMAETSGRAGNKQDVAQWVRWIFPTISGLVMLFIAIANFIGG